MHRDSPERHGSGPSVAIARSSDCDFRRGGRFASVRRSGAITHRPHSISRVPLRPGECSRSSISNPQTSGASGDRCRRGYDRGEGSRYPDRGTRPLTSAGARSGTGSGWRRSSASRSRGAGGATRTDWAGSFLRREARRAKSHRGRERAGTAIAARGIGHHRARSDGLGYAGRGHPDRWAGGIVSGWGRSAGHSRRSHGIWPRRWSESSPIRCSGRHGPPGARPGHRNTTLPEWQTGWRRCIVPPYS